MATWAQYWGSVADQSGSQWYMDPGTGMWRQGVPPPGAMTQAQYQQQTMAGMPFQTTPSASPTSFGGAGAGAGGRPGITPSGLPPSLTGIGTGDTGGYAGRPFPTSPSPGVFSGNGGISMGGAGGGVTPGQQPIFSPPSQTGVGNGSTEGYAGRPFPTLPTTPYGGGGPSMGGGATLGGTINPGPPTGSTPPSLGGPTSYVPPMTGGRIPPWVSGVPTSNPVQGGPGYGPGGGGAGGIGGAYGATNPPQGGSGPLTPTADPATNPMAAILAGTPQGSPADTFLSSSAMGSMDALRGFATNGHPIDQTPAWQAMVDAQRRNIDEGQASLNAQFDVGGGRFSSAFGTASTDYRDQAVKNQNALLAQMTAQAGESAQGRSLSAAGQIGQLGQAGASQLSSQDFQSIMQQYGISADMAKYMAGGSDAASSQLAGLGAAGSNALYGGSIAGANSLFGGENSAAMGMYQGQNQTLPSFMSYLLGTNQQGNAAAGDLSGLWNSNLQTGLGIGQSQYTDQQSAINNAYQEWLRTQPTNNPLLSMMFSGATGYPQMYNPSYQPGILGSLLGTVGQIGGAIAGRQG